MLKHKISPSRRKWDEETVGRGIVFRWRNTVTGIVVRGINGRKGYSVSVGVIPGKTEYSVICDKINSSRW